MPRNNKKNKRGLISTQSFERQLQIELEHEVLSELKVRRTRELRRKVRAELAVRIKGALRDDLSNRIDEIKRETREAVQPYLDKAKQKAETKREIRYFQRLGLSIRLQHGIMAASVILLIITGMPLKFPDVPVLVSVMKLLGGIENSTYLHRIGACVLITVSLWHLFYVIFLKKGRRDFFLMIPNGKDVRNFIEMMAFYLGRSSEKPAFGRFSYVEKFDYWAVYWGCVIMIGSGILLWSPELTFSWFPKYLYDIAKEIHSDEALLATLAIVIWHFYNVHFNPSVFPGSMVWLHGRKSEEEMREEHPLELEDILAEEARQKIKKSEGV